MAKRRKKVSTAKKKEWAWGYLFVLPNLIGFCVFFVLPVIYGIIVSLTNYNGFKKFDFIGIQNYINLFKDKFFVIALKNNIFSSICTIDYFSGFDIGPCVKQAKKTEWLI